MFSEWLLSDWDRNDRGSGGGGSVGITGEGCGIMIVVLVGILFFSTLIRGCINPEPDVYERIEKVNPGWKNHGYRPYDGSRRSR